MRNMRLFSGLAAAATLALAGSVAQAAIQVDSDGVPFTFDTLPPADEFSTFAITGNGAAAEDETALDTAVQALSVSGSGFVVMPESPTNPPSSNALFRRNTTNLNVQSRPTGVTATTLLATLQNATGGDIPGITFEYDLTTFDPAATPEVLQGHKAYYSLTGNANEWTPVGRFAPTTPPGEPQRTAINITTPAVIPNGGILYLLLVDDNADVITDPSYTIDNVLVSVVPEPATFGLVTLGAMGLLARRRRV